MAYLDVPRFHFRGSFYCNPATLNNFAESFDRNQPLPAADANNWSPDGSNYFTLGSGPAPDPRSAAPDPPAVVRVVDRAGRAVRDGRDSLINCSVACIGNGKIADLDVDRQTVPQLYGLRIRVVSRLGVTLLEGDVEAATCRDTWLYRRVRQGEERSVRTGGGGFQSVIKVVEWGPTTGSPTLESLTALSRENDRRSDRRALLSIKFVVFGYDRAMKRGTVVGTIGPYFRDEPEGAIAARCLSSSVQVHASAGGYAPPQPVDGQFGRVEGLFGSSPFKLAARGGRRVALVMDLANALPEDAAGEPYARRITLRLLHPQRRGGPVLGATLGSIRLSAEEIANTAGVFEIPLAPGIVREAEGSPVGLFLDGPGVRALRGRHPLRIYRSLDENKPVMAERDDGGHVEPSDMVLRLEAGPSGPGAAAVLGVFGTRFGRTAPDQVVGVAVAVGTGGATAGLALPAPLTLSSGGPSPLRVASDSPPAPARRGIDGQTYEVTLHWGATADAGSYVRSVLVRVFDPFPAPRPEPRWEDVGPIFEMYGRLYPYMRDRLPSRLDLASPATFDDVNKLGLIYVLMNLPVENPAYMPLTRDLSAAKREAMLAYLRSRAREHNVSL